MPGQVLLDVFRKYAHCGAKCGMGCNREEGGGGGGVELKQLAAHLSRSVASDAACTRLRDQVADYSQLNCRFAFCLRVRNRRRWR